MSTTHSMVEQHVPMPYNVDGTQNQASYLVGDKSTFQAYLRCSQGCKQVRLQHCSRWRWLLLDDSCRGIRQKGCPLLACQSRFTWLGSFHQLRRHAYNRPSHQQQYCKGCATAKRCHSLEPFAMMVLALKRVRDKTSSEHLDWHVHNENSKARVPDSLKNKA